MQFEEQQPIYIQIADEFCKNIILDKWQQMRESLRWRCCCSFGG